MTPSEARRMSSELPLVNEPKEWAGAEDSEDEKPVEKIEKHASRSFEAREKRLSVAAVSLQNDKILGVPSERLGVLVSCVSIGLWSSVPST